ncbi:hypothetical protein LTR09_007746 [Extremus antarcticus]|uniref:Uncharacterized protein n=1 Tax=Extremus antarcticus TaxID=702011 RepID=A0AAJ0DC45_9PEZI|nr:hypothetical protein LTR09_007746 [Extremus antarcticus]
MSLKGKTAIVTGSSKPTGIGAAVAFALAEQGANIVVHYSSSAESAQAVVKQIEGLGAQAVAIKADASSKDFRTTLVEGTLKAFNTQTIDIIVNNAGTAAVHPSIADVEVDSWDTVYHVNVRAPFLLIQAAVPHMKDSGRIINIGSIVARSGNKMLTAYASSKAAVTSMSVSLAEELGPKGITVNVVAPGPIATEMSMKGSPIYEKLMNNAHIKRERTAREVASAVAWLASPNAGYVTGQLIGVDGGVSFPIGV